MSNSLYFLSHSPINNLHFTKNSSDFVVEEIPLYPFSGNGEHLVLNVRKKDLTTWAMISDIAKHCGAKNKDIGYAGLKDKDGLCIQYISIHKKYEPMLQNFSHEKIKILNTTYHDNKIKIGHLKGNRFFIRLKKVNPVDSLKLKQALDSINIHGYPNYFGYQRFGRDGDNFELGKEILEGKRKEKNPKMHDFFISAYQSHLFNLWLSKRVGISKMFESFDVKELAQIFSWNKDILKNTKNQPQWMKIFNGDVMHHYPHGKAYLCENEQEESERMSKRDVTLTGWLIGKRAMRSEGAALEIEDEIYTDTQSVIDKMDGSRRFAWSFIENLEYEYKEEQAWFEMHFTLQKGSYATTVLEQILCKELDIV